MSNTNFLVAGNLIKHFHCLLLPRIKNKYFCFFKERLCSIKRLLLFFTQFSKLILWRRSFPVLSTDACIALSYFCCFPMSVSKKRYIGRILILPDSYMWQKFNKMNEKRSLGYQSGGVEYVTGQINSRILQLFWDDFTVWFLHCLGNLNMLWSDKAFTQQPFISINTALSGSYKSLLSNL